ncbi:hypothetical protein INT43_005264 [Umbelopsis isabellina]|uniref:RING-type domain-containing protein n=1 Tax=Mortierella isabellina TaxID=91625 RepID=A0A8H7UBU6_MORIS|nr:hypothetical protein INT43_005264 [Umbelopsis isabellina]
MRLRSSWYTLLSLALFLATFAVYLRSFSRMQHAFMATLKSGSLDDLEQLDGMIENLDIHIDEADRHRFAHHLANASFSKDSMGYVRAFIKYIEGEKMAVLVNAMLLFDLNIRHITIMISHCFNLYIILQIWVNMFYCFLVMLGKIICKTIFGRMLRFENQHLYDNMLNFVLFKVIFICAVMNPRWAQVLVLALWIGILGFLHIFCKLSRDRFDHLSVSPSVSLFQLYKVVGLLCVIVISCFLWYYGCIHLFPSMLGFLTLEAVPVAIDTCQLLIKYVAHIFDNINDDQMQFKGIIMYYSELLADLLILLCTILQYLQLLVSDRLWIWAQWMHGRSFGWTDVILLLNLRSAFKHLRRKIVTHAVHWRAMSALRSTYLQASPADLQTYGDQCAICRETMKEATKLPCAHCFHLSCLHSWIHHRPSQATCPTCRTLIGPSVLSDNTSPEAAVTSSIWGGKYLLSLLPWNIEVSLTARNSQFDDTSSVYSMDDRDDNMSIASTSTSGYRPMSGH